MDVKESRADHVVDDGDDEEDDDLDYNPECEPNCSDKSDSDSDSLDEDIGVKQNGKKNGKSSAKSEEEKQCLTDEQQKQRADSLWAQFCEDLPDTAKSAPNETNASIDYKSANESSINSTNDDKVLVTKIYEFAGESVSVEEEVQKSDSTDRECVNIECKDKEKSDLTAGKSAKRSSGLAGVLDKLKKPKISTLTKSLHDWNQFKKNEGIEEEMSQHNRSKDAFIEKQSFLQRTDLRQFEIEKDIRSRNRTQQLYKN